MPFASRNDLSFDATLHADICIVGSGPAGLSLAVELARAGRDVILVESGGQPDEGDSVTVAEIETTGAAPGDTARPLHHRRFGGTEWYGRCIAFAPIEFEAPPGVETGWPIPVGEIACRYERAAAFLGLSKPAAADLAFWNDDPAVAALRGGGIEPDVHVLTGGRLLGRRYRAEASRLPTLRVLLHATAVGIEVDRATHVVTGLRVADARGSAAEDPAGRSTIRAGRCVLACGGLENPRLMLMLARDCPDILGPSSEMVGRGYMNHVRTEGVGRLTLNPAHPRSHAFFRRLTLQYSRRARGWMQIGAALAPELRRREGLRGAGAFFHGASTAELAALKSDVTHVATGRRPSPAALRRLAAGLPLLTRAGIARLRQEPFAIDHLVLVDQIEQPFDPESRVMLSDRRDRFGRPEIQLRWRIDPETRRAQRRLHAEIARRVEALGIGALESRLLESPDYEAPVSDARHPTGATRMAVDPRLGVVDADLRVHGLENLYIAGSSVFPSGGYAGPTLTIVALSLRLADQILRDGPNRRVTR